MILVDSSVWIDYFNGKPTSETEYLNGILGIRLVCIADLILTEVLQGFRNDKDFTTAKNLLTSLSIQNVLNTPIALQSADNFRFLRKRGITVRKTVDVIIATFCIENNLPLLHSDKDFIHFHDHLNLTNAMNLS